MGFETEIHRGCAVIRTSLAHVNRNVDNRCCVDEPYRNELDNKNSGRDVVIFLLCRFKQA
jgi:hypothetical protein